MGVCSISLRGQARRLATNAGVSAEEALKEWTANLIPGVTVIPSGTWGVNRAQEAGCTYCAGGCGSSLWRPLGRSGLRRDLHVDHIRVLDVQTGKVAL